MTPGTTGQARRKPSLMLLERTDVHLTLGVIDVLCWFVATFALVAFRCDFELSMNNPDAGLRIVGEGSQLARLTRLVDELELTQHVRSLRMMGTSPLKLEHNKCDAFVLASASETFGILYREATGAGRPIVAVNGGLQGDFEDRNGLFVKENLVGPLAQAMVATIDRSDLKGISIRCLKKYSASSDESKVLEVQRRALNA